MFKALNDLKHEWSRTLMVQKANARKDEYIDINGTKYEWSEEKEKEKKKKHKRFKILLIQNMNSIKYR